MGTNNPRVAAYLPPELYKAFLDFKFQRGLATESSPKQNDSQALIQILFEFFGVNHSVTHSIVHQLDLLQDENFQDLCRRLDAIEQKIVYNSHSDLLSELLKKISQLESQVEVLKAQSSKDLTLSTGELAKRLGIDNSTLSHWKNPNSKKGKSPDDLLKSIRDRDPDGIGWILIPELNRFKPEKPLPGDSPPVQGELLSATPSDQVNPLPEGSEQSGEG